MSWFIAQVIPWPVLRAFHVMRGKIKLVNCFFFFLSLLFYLFIFSCAVFPLLIVRKEGNKWIVQLLLYWRVISVLLITSELVSFILFLSSQACVWVIRKSGKHWAVILTPSVLGHIFYHEFEAWLDDFIGVRKGLWRREKLMARVCTVWILHMSFWSCRKLTNNKNKKMCPSTEGVEEITRLLGRKEGRRHREHKTSGRIPNYLPQHTAIQINPVNWWGIEIHQRLLYYWHTEHKNYLPQHTARLVKVSLHIC